MDIQPPLYSIDTIVYQHTSHHLDTLQTAILTGVLQGQKYADIAQTCHCTEGHVKDKAYALWNLLSPLLGEDIQKNNAKAAIERFITHNTGSQFENHHSANSVNINNLNLYPHPDPTTVALQQAQTTPTSYHSRAILKLHHLGLPPTTIADTLEIPLSQVTTTLHTHPPADL